MLLLEVNKFVFMSLKGGFSVSYSFPVLSVVSPTGFQYLLRGLIFPVLDPRAWVPNVQLEPLTP